MSDIVNSNQQNEQIVEEPLTKPKKPRTQKQLEAFQKVQEKRQKNIEEKKKQKTRLGSAIACAYVSKGLFRPSSGTDFRFLADNLRLRTRTHTHMRHDCDEGGKKGKQKKGIGTHHTTGEDERYSPASHRGTNNHAFALLTARPCSPACRWRR